MITFGIDGGACKTALPGNHPAARGYKVHCDGQYGAEYDTASNKNIWSKGEIILYATGVRGTPLVLNTRKVACRRPWPSMGAMTDQGQWVAFWSEQSRICVSPR